MRPGSARIHHQAAHYLQESEGPKRKSLAYVWTGACSGYDDLRRFVQTRAAGSSPSFNMSRLRYTHDKYSYMLKPAWATVMSGVSTLARSHSVHRGGCFLPSMMDEATRLMGVGDLFIWVGRYGLDFRDRRTNRSPITVLEQLQRRGVWVVYYNADPGDCGWTHALPVQEIWDYSHSTLRECEHWDASSRRGPYDEALWLTINRTCVKCASIGAVRRALQRQRGNDSLSSLQKKTTRYVPPGFYGDPNLPTTIAARERSSTWPPARDAHRILFLGIADARHPRRLECLSALRTQLNRTNAGSSPQLSIEHDNGAWTDTNLRSAVDSSLFVINLHQRCGLEVCLRLTAVSSI